ncbi:MAG: FmdB family zinc ribbon protein [Solirubrobacterales bacterium]
MPIYEYRCTNGHTFEAFQSMIDDSLDVCEVCDAAAQRVLSAPAVHFKGSGFYTTDYARKGAGKEGAAGGSDGDGDSSSGGDSKSDSSSGGGESKSGSDSKSEKKPAASSSTSSGGSSSSDS